MYDESDLYPSGADLQAQDAEHEEATKEERPVFAPHSIRLCDNPQPLPF